MIGECFFGIIVMEYLRAAVVRAGLDSANRIGTLALFVNRQHDGMGRRIDIEPDDVGELDGKAGIARALEDARQTT
jgi:hypothetical protein